MSSTEAVLPDPTEDLHWSAFRGPIHDIFAKNAQSHPERLCILETGSASNPSRSFTYGQINAAVNVLSHHLIRSGIVRGDVVMIYAHRGVDLVVAIMGVLKAGGTFSVIDPAYPPDRQIVYLEVARPRALIAIEAATREAGPISEKVESFIKEHLELRTQISCLKINADGSLQGGVVGGQDILAPVQSLQDMEPGVLVGPDSNPTLSFTSGSEGRPKGVLGRHFSLTYYFPWMSERFGLGPNDRFTMLSGIAHDPIQRDIFTPLFLGAQLLIPAQEDIQNEKLAEWMRTNGATVCHLTPAMGQILVGGATAEFPSLHHAFFVGDVLIKRDCRALQRLAPEVKIVNMYGSTETSRAVSYYEIRSRNEDPSHLESLKDVIPAGKGMKDVQLLVVDRVNQSRLCEIGEVGEIYVRAGGLAEGYLGLPDLTKAKFLTNWFTDTQRWKDADEASNREDEPWREFYFGPRDRLYQTGDLGRYTAEGDVECCGRADDQVKIRGFRIELGEIDTFLSQHPLVRENVTMVRKDKDEEPALVSYIVPEMGRWRQRAQEKGIEEVEAGAEDMASMLSRFRPLRDELRKYLREKLPMHSVPGVIIPLKKMPLNPNGKIDKPVLPFPDQAQLAAAASKSTVASNVKRSETEQALAEIWSSLITHVDVDAISPDDSFFDLGGHSILAQQMIFAVRRRWKGIDLSMSTIFSCPTLAALARDIDRRRGIDFDVKREMNGNHAENGLANGAGQTDYAADAQRLVGTLPEHFPSALNKLDPAQPVTIFLTGASGFLGAYILRDLLSRAKPLVSVIAHVRAEDATAGMERVRQTCQAYGIWSPTWSSRISCITGDLAKPQLGLSDPDFTDLANKVDMVIHNGAWVHWVYPYQHLRASNVESTIEALRLCSQGKPKRFVFVSSTSVLDSPHYVQLSEQIISSGGKGISEADDLSGSRTGLGTGYGQSKWVAEYLVQEAGKRGLIGAIVRPGYVVGDSSTGVTNTDDFLVRMLKGCVQLSARPRIENTVNSVPVNHVARTVVTSAFFPPRESFGVVHVTSHPRLRFCDFLATLEKYGYQVPEVEYSSWRTRLEQYVGNDDGNREPHALLPLYHFATTNLPEDTKAPEMDDINAIEILKRDAKLTGEDVSNGMGVTEDLMGLYLAYLVGIGFMPKPGKEEAKKILPEIEISEEQRDSQRKAGGRAILG
ncbi:MAG: large subunit of alpha-aminoadipate reductase [Watsoniomyces obsoletus]|nr:MAG: large subunit of alpha-aminoadipate reductase [Watsoniomyces obsoletus]